MARPTKDMIDRAWIDRFRALCQFQLCKVWKSIVGERPLSTSVADQVGSGPLIDPPHPRSEAEVSEAIRVGPTTAG